MLKIENKIIREFEELSIRILNLFDLKEDDDYNIKLLYSFKIKELNCDLLYLAYKGRCQKFVSTLTVQKTIQMMWNSFDMNANKSRKDHNKQRFKSNGLNFKVRK